MESGGRFEPAAQDNVAAPPQQPSDQPLRAARAGWRLAVPWLILACWAAADLAVLGYWAIREWGFLEDLLLILGLLFHQLGMLAWVTAMALLADWRLSLRLAYFALGGVIHVGVMSCIFHYPSQTDLAVAVAAMVVAWSMPFLWLRRRGRRISASPGRPQCSGVWQFTIGDVLVGTSQAGAFLALLLASAAKFQRGELIVYVLLLLGAPAVVLIALAWRRFWLAALVCVLLSAALTLLPMWWLAPNFQLIEAGLVLAIVGIGTLSLLASAGCLRWAGYRLR